MIHCQDVHKSYTSGGHRVHALRGASLTIDTPGFYGAMGASGSGKSTLLHLLGGLDAIDSGSIRVGEHDLHSLDEAGLTEYRRSGVGIVFQSFNLIATLTARENVELPGVIAGRDASWLRDRSNELLDALGVTHRSDHRPDAMSGGEQQRTAIARALLFSPPVLLADEPTGNLDSRSSSKLWELLRSIASEQQITVFMVTHEPAAATHCERVFVLSDGTIIDTFATEGLDAGSLASRYQHATNATPA
ncbi:MAG: ABC transporter ATP-binding protein [Phycisphaerales bacterium JB043]